ncbi:hypothetical protein SAMN04488121_1068 [Chitinophaga filiformis]|uniref:Uncharacterized protein n=1 Tax=Chitinophaga filiformis TaxID=104663 RepID=A0A1G7WIT7_CHIFI|nr:hypothetical protein SAMN04488121_1068 [Chitinophaga filiformis]
MAILPERLKIQLLTHEVNEGTLSQYVTVLRSYSLPFGGAIQWMKKSGRPALTLKKCLRTSFTF